MFTAWAGSRWIGNTPRRIIDKEGKPVAENDFILAVNIDLMAWEHGANNNRRQNA